MNKRHVVAADIATGHVSGDRLLIRIVVVAESGTLQSRAATIEYLLLGSPVIDQVTYRVLSIISADLTLKEISSK